MTKEMNFEELFIPNPYAGSGGLTHMLRGFDPGKQSCPGCTHGENFHVAGMCYACGHCGWSLLGKGNSYGLPEGWHDWNTDANSYPNAKAIPFGSADWRNL